MTDERTNGQGVSRSRIQSMVSCELLDITSVIIASECGRKSHEAVSCRDSLFSHHTHLIFVKIVCFNASFDFLATLVALHFTLVSK